MIELEACTSQTKSFQSYKATQSPVNDYLLDQAYRSNEQLGNSDSCYC